MKLELDLNGLLCTLEQVPKCKEDAPLLGDGYLTTAVVLPYLAGEEISLNEIDWDAFSAEDAEEMMYRCDEAIMLSRGVQICVSAIQCRPIVEYAVSFV